MDLFFLCEYLFDCISMASNSICRGAIFLIGLRLGWFFITDGMFIHCGGVVDTFWISIFLSLHLFLA